MSKLIAWSYSRLTSYEQCPKKYHAISVAKSVKDPPNEHSVYGDMVHKAFAKYIEHGTHLPLAIRHFEKFLAPIRAAPGEKVIEQKITLNPAYQPTGWFDKDAYIRVISDLTQLNGRTGVVWDWKTGKPTDDFTQLKLTGAVTFLLAEELEELTLAYFWLKTKQVAPMKMLREEATSVWSEILPRVQRYQTAHEEVDFPPRPSYLCAYCPIISCPFNKKR